MFSYSTVQVKVIKSSEADATIVGNSGVTDSQSVASVSPNKLEPSPISPSHSISSKILWKRKKRQDMKKLQARHLTSEDNIRNTQKDED
jgi:hypothetical protein